MSGANTAPEIVIIDDDVRRAQWVRESRVLAGRSTLVVGWGPEVRPLIRLMSPQLVVAGVSATGTGPQRALREVRDDGYVDPILVVGDGVIQQGVSDLATAYVTTSDHVALDAQLQSLVGFASDAQRGLDAATRFVHFESAVVDLADSSVVRTGRRVRMSPTEFALFSFLHEHRGRIVLRETLLGHVWGANPPASRVVDRHITTLRRHIETDPRRPRFLRTVFGKGYVLQA